jgi:RHS repeat-associated protein
MQPHRETLLCRYHYDPLDRLADCTPTAQANTQRFYLKDRLATEVQGARQRSIMQHEDQLLAQQQRQNGTPQSHLLATDRQRSVQAILDAIPLQHLAYTPYGHRVPESGLLSLLGFNGERPDPVTGHYLLGNGYRAFNPVLMRFNSPDSWSPFGRGGLNAYGYGVGDPVNRYDPTGHTPIWVKNFLRSIGLMRKKTPVVGPNSSNTVATPSPNYAPPIDIKMSPKITNNQQTNSSPNPQKKPLNMPKEEAFEKISALEEAEKHTKNEINKLRNTSNILGDAISIQRHRNEKRYYGRDPEYPTSSTTVEVLVRHQNAIREQIIKHNKSLYEMQQMRKIYLAHTQ